MLDQERRTKALWSKRRECRRDCGLGLPVARSNLRGRRSAPLPSDSSPCRMLDSKSRGTSCPAEFSSRHDSPDSKASHHSIYRRIDQRAHRRLCYRSGAWLVRTIFERCQCPQANVLRPNSSCRWLLDASASYILHRKDCPSLAWAYNCTLNLYRWRRRACLE